MENSRLVTVVTLTYKKFDNIYKAVKSVLNQDYKRIEYIIADDGSDNFPEEQLRKYIEENKKSNLTRHLILRHPNVGTVKNINYAYAYATGDYIVSLSQDDCYLNNKVISQLVKAFEDINRGERKKDLMISSRVVCNEKGKPLYLLPHVLHRHKLVKMSRRELYSHFISGQYFSMASGSVFFLRNKKIRNFYDEKYRLWEDGPYVEKYLREFDILLNYDLISIKYKLGGVSTGKPNPQLVEDTLAFDATDRVAHMDLLPIFMKKLAMYNISEYYKKNHQYISEDDSSKHNKKLKQSEMLYKIVNLDVIIYKIWYKIDNIISICFDKVYLFKNREYFR